MLETLEERQLMSLTIEIRAADGSASTTVSAVGQVVNLEVIGIVSAGTLGTGDTTASTNAATFGIDDVTGSIISSSIWSHAVAGNMTAAVVGPFHASAAQNGTPQDLNGDGNIDVGSNDGTKIEGYFFARHGSIDTSGTLSSTSNTIELGTISYTVTSLNDGGETGINFSPRPSFNSSAGGSGLYYTAIWNDGIEYSSGGSVASYADDLNSSLIIGSPFVISDPAKVIPPVAGNETVTATRDIADTINVLSVVDAVAPVDPTTVKVVSNVANGATTVNADGTITYTPTTGFTGTDSFTYTVEDDQGRLSNAGTVSITVAPPPPPVAVADSAQTVRGEATTISVLSNDTDADGTITPSTVMISTGASHGTATAQSDGTVLYTPSANFIGTDTFSYTVGDSLGDTSAPATVTVVVAAPTLPTAVDDIASATEGVPLSINVIANDIAPSASIDPTSVKIVNAAGHGSAVPQSDGTVLYTPAAGYVGTDSFTYSFADALGDVSANTGTVTLSIIAAAAPVVAPPSTVPTALAGTSTVIPVLNSASGAVALVPASVTITTQPAGGTATVDATTGDITYTPSSTFVGTDSLQYTVADINGNVSTPATLSIQVGVEISSAKGANKSITFVDATGGTETVTLSSGTADLTFTGTATSSVAHNKVTLTNPSNLEIAGITVSGSKKSSVLAVRGVRNAPVTIGGITATTPLGVISAPTATVSGTVDIAGLTSMTVAGLSSATVTIGSSGAARAALTLGTVSATSLSSAVALSLVRVNSWTNDQSTGSVLALTAPSLASLISTGGFNPNVTLSPTGKTAGISSARITGQLGGAWTDSGSAGSITAGSVADNWSGNVSGALLALTVHSGTFNSTLTAGSIGTLAVTGDLDATITAGSAKVIRSTGQLFGTTINLTTSLTSLTAASMDNASITVGTPSGTTLTSQTSATLGSGVIGSIRLTGKSGSQFTNSDILAGKITSLALGSVASSNSSVAEGVATNSLHSFTGVFSGTAVHLGLAQLASEPQLQSYINQQTIPFGDFEISLPA